ncbi:MAG: hypothetical protein RSG48_05235, partial [Clostridia bacterium]
MKKNMKKASLKNNVNNFYEASSIAGISLIVLVITIIVIIILAAAVILTLNKNNPMKNANKASFQNDLDTFKSDLSLSQSKK